MINQGATAYDNVMEALGHQTRREILALLRQRPLPVGEIAAYFPISRPAVSKHLRLLKNAELVEYDSQGRRNIFRLNQRGFQVAQSYLQDFWDEALSNFQQLIEEELEKEI